MAAGPQGPRLPQAFFWLGCAALVAAESGGHLSAVISVKYQNAGGFDISGRIHVSEKPDGRQMLTYSLQGVDGACGRKAPVDEDSCGLRVHSGSRCTTEILAWEPALAHVNYTGDGDVARGTTPLLEKMTLQDMHGLFVVVHDSHGKPIGCGELKDLPTQGESWCLTEEAWREQSALNFSGAFQRCGPELICPQDHQACEETCVLSEECERFPLRVCDKHEMRCRHKTVFEAVPGVDVGVALLFWVISGMALSAGIGGGGLYVPLLMVVLGFSVREATALSQACLAGGATTNLFYTLRQQHPTKPKPAIDYDLVLVMGPCLLVGALIGSALNASAPSWLILALLLVVLVRSAFEALKKAMKLWRAEQARARLVGGSRSAPRLEQNPIERLLRCCRFRSYTPFEDSQPAATKSPPGQVLGAAAGGNGCVDNAAAAPAATAATTWPAAEPQVPPASTPQLLGDGARLSEVETDLVDVDLVDSVKSVRGGVASTTPSEEQHKEPQFPKADLMMLFLMWLVTVISVLVRGGRAAPGLVNFCSAGYWVLAVLTALVLAALAVLGARRAVRRAATAPQGLEDLSPPGDDAELVWTPSAARRVACWSLFAGTLAALCGIGGGMIMGPILLRLGFAPKVQSATTGTTLFVMSTSTALAFLVQGVAPKGYAFFLAAATGLGALSGKAVIGWLVKRSGHESLLSFLLGGIIALSVVVMGISGSIDVANDIREGQDLLFAGLCSAA